MTIDRNAAPTNKLLQWREGTPTPSDAENTDLLIASRTRKSYWPQDADKPENYYWKFEIVWKSSFGNGLSASDEFPDLDERDLSEIKFWVPCNGHDGLFGTLPSPT